MAAHETDLPEQEDKPSTESSKTTTPAGRGLAFWPILCIVQFGVVGILFGLWIRSTKEANKDELHVIDPSKLIGFEENKTPAESLDILKADDLLRAGRFDQALKYFQNERERGQRDPITYRIALCQEGLNHLDTAAMEYQTIASRSPGSGTGMAAQLGHARVLAHMGRLESSKELLSKLLLCSGHRSKQAQGVIADARLLFALALSQETWPRDTPSLTNDLPVRRGLGLPLEFALKLVPLEPEAEVPAPDNDVLLVQQAENWADILIRANGKHFLIGDMIEQIAIKAALRVSWTDRAKRHIEGRTTLICVENMRLIDLLRALIEQTELAWREENGQLQLCSTADLSEKEREAFRLQMVEGALKHVLLDPENPFAPYAYLELGNLNYSTNRLKESITWWDQLLNQWGRSPLAVQGCYNLGLAYAKLSRPDVARNYFYRVVDRAPGHLLAVQAYMRIGMMFLDDNDAERAVSPLRRAIGMIRNPGEQPVNLLILANAYLLNDNPAAANELLVRYRDSFQAAPYRYPTAFLDSLARYRMLPERKRTHREATEVLSALLSVREDRTLRMPGLYLMGQAYRELGLIDQMVQLYEKELPGTRGTLAMRMSADLAEAYFQSSNWEQAIKFYGAIEKGAPEEFARQARYRLAEIALHIEKPKETLIWCDKLLKSARNEEKRELLRLMGSAYQVLNEPELAAKCFAGEAPRRE